MPKEIHKFKKGYKLQLEEIMQIQGLAGGLWWQKTGDDVEPGDPFGADIGDEIIITRDITIEIRWTDI